VKNGTYSNPGVIINGLIGTAQTPTSILAYPAHSPAIQGAGVHTGRLRIQNANHFVFAGFAVTLQNDGLFIVSSTNGTIRDNNIHNVGQVCIAIKANSSFILIQNNVCHDTGTWTGTSGEGLYIGTGSAGPLDNSNNITVLGNTIYNNTDEGIELKPGTHDNIVDGNLIYNNGTQSSWPTTDGAGIEVNQHSAGVQTWGSNPAHIIRNNIIRNTKTAIRAGTGSLVYNNLIYALTTGHYGIYVNNLSSDAYTRVIYHNTIDMTSANAVKTVAGATDIKNNIGPTGSGNIFTADSYYVDKAGADYHLAVGSAPVNAGLDLTAVVPTDIEGKSRLANPPPDLGAYELAGLRPAPPTKLRVAP
jgi:parallel beta-helix repeat protein